MTDLAPIIEFKPLQAVEDFLTEHDISPSTFGMAAVRDGRLVMDLRNGRDMGFNKIREVLKLIVDLRALSNSQEIIEALRKRAAEQRIAGKETVIENSDAPEIAQDIAERTGKEQPSFPRCVVAT